MTREEAIKMAKADLKCMERDTSGQDEMCNNHKCDECSLNYERGNMGEQKEWLRLAIKALDQEPCEDAVSRAEVIKIAKEMYLEVANMNLDVKTISDCISYTSSKCREVLERKLQALSSVTPQEPGVDKIRAEIEEINVGITPLVNVYKVLDIIDRYKAESEG